MVNIVVELADSLRGSVLNRNVLLTPYTVESDVVRRVDSFL